MHVFLRLRSVLALLSFDCRFECVEPSFRRKTRSWSQDQSRELAKQAQHTQYGRSKAKIHGSRQEQNAAYGERGGQDGQRPPRFDRGGHHEPWWLPWPARGGSHGRCGCFSPGYFVFPLRHFVSLRTFSMWAAVLALKGGCIWPIGWGEFVAKTLFHSQKLHWRRRRKKKIGEAKAAFLVANRNIGTQALHKLSYLRCFLSFSSILVRISECYLVS